MRMCYRMSARRRPRWSASFPVVVVVERRKETETEKKGVEEKAEGRTLGRARLYKR